jgi:hypothetical protein
MRCVCIIPIKLPMHGRIGISRRINDSLWFERAVNDERFKFFFDRF